MWGGVGIKCRKLSRKWNSGRRIPKVREQEFGEGSVAGNGIRVGAKCALSGEL